MIAGLEDTGAGDIDSKYNTDQATAFDSVTGAKAYKTTLPYGVEQNTTDQATARGVMAMASLATLPIRAEPKNQKNRD